MEGLGRGFRILYLPAEEGSYVRKEWKEIH